MTATPAAVSARDFISAYLGRSERAANYHGHRPVTVAAFGEEHYLIDAILSEGLLVLLVQRAPAPFFNHSALERKLYVLEREVGGKNRFRPVTLTDGDRDGFVTSVNYGDFAATITAHTRDQIITQARAAVR